jgi:hypothetical protein
MGAWGSGVMANDTALDYESTFEDDVIPLLTEAKYEEGIKKALDIAMEWDGDGEFGYHSFLAALQLLLDFRIDSKLINADERIEKIFEAELGENLEQWCDTAIRKNVLNILQKRLRGEQLSAEDREAIAYANRGLFDRF